MNDEHPFQADRFPATRWSLVLTARGDDEARARRALGELCEVYWFPIYCYIRNRGFSKLDAEDLTQSYFEGLIRRNALANTKPAEGKLRAYLLASVKNFFYMENRNAEAAVDESLYFDRTWAKATVERVLAKMRASINDAVAAAQFDALSGVIHRSTISRNIQSGNDPEGGGGLYIRGNGTEVLLVNTTVAENRSQTNGGGIRVTAGARLKLLQSTVSANSAATGGGISNAGGFLSMGNSIVAGNSGGDIFASAPN